VSVPLITPLAEVLASAGWNAVPLRHTGPALPFSHLIR